jgi:hypothetical protein
VVLSEQPAAMPIQERLDLFLSRLIPTERQRLWLLKKSISIENRQNREIENV